MAVLLTASAMEAFVGLSIEKICPLKFGKIGDVESHCAHFVGHVLKLNSTAVHGTTCAGMMWEGKKHKDAGAVIRVNDIYNACDDLKEEDETGCLAYYTVPENIDKNGYMGAMSKKHVGVCIGGHVYNYGNTNDKVRKDVVGGLASLYGSKTITKYTKLPSTAKLLMLADILALVPAPATKK